MTLHASLPRNCSSETQWIISVLLEDFLGLGVSCSTGDGNEISIEAEGRRFVSPIAFFPQPENWLLEKTLPAGPFPSWDTSRTGLTMHLQEDQVPVLSGQPGAEITPTEIRLHWDIFGSAFFLLSRYEEAVAADLDQHGRVSLGTTLGGRHGLLSRPLVDEYVEILWACFHHLWPRLVRRPRSFEMEISCDLDHVFTPEATSLPQLTRKIASEILLYRSARQARGHLTNFFSTRRGDRTRDPFLGAAYQMMDINESLGNRMIFNFKSNQSNPAFDAPVDLDEPAVRSLLKNIHDRGHAIGFHPSYLTHTDGALFNSELEMLRRVLHQEKIDAEVVGGRQHYLRWRTPETARLWEKAGLEFDSTLGFAQQAGFRCGTSRKFQLYDVEERRPLNLREHPLVLMDVSVIFKQYMGLGRTRAALEFMEGLKSTCRFYGGCFSILWHNSFLRTPWDLAAYRQLCTSSPTTPGNNPPQQTP